MQKKLSKKGNVTLYFVAIVVMILVILMTAFFAPMGALFSEQMYLAGEDVIDMALDDINSISDSGVRDAVNQSFVSAADSTTTNIAVSTALFQYAWLFLLAIVGIVVFLAARAIVEVNSSRGFV